MSKDEKKGAITVAEAGRRGGKSTSSRHGHEFYKAMGKKGGKTTSQRYGHEFYVEIGKKGGQKVKELIALAKEASKR